MNRWRRGVEAPVVRSVRRSSLAPDPRSLPATQGHPWATPNTASIRVNPSTSALAPFATATTCHTANKPRAKAS